MNEQLPPDEYCLQAHIQNLSEISARATKLLNRDGVPNTRKLTLAMAFYQGALDSFDAIWCLADRKLYGPSIALLRPTFESFVRGYFVHHVANDDTIRHMYETSNFRTLPSYVQRIAAADTPQSEWILEFGTRFLRFLDDATHGGESQLQFRIRHGEIIPCYPPEAMRAFLNAASLIFIRSVNELFDIFDDPDSKDVFNSIGIMH